MAEKHAGKIAILKSMWRKDGADKWVIHDIQACSAEPTAWTRHRPPFLILWLDGIPSVPSIVPIIAWNDGDEEMRCIGTSTDCCAWDRGTITPADP